MSSHAREKAREIEGRVVAQKRQLFCVRYGPIFVFAPLLTMAIFLLKKTKESSAKRVCKILFFFVFSLSFLVVLFWRRGLKYSCTASVNKLLEKRAEARSEAMEFLVADIVLKDLYISVPEQWFSQDVDTRYLAVAAAALFLKLKKTGALFFISEPNKSNGRLDEECIVISPNGKADLISLLALKSKSQKYFSLGKRYGLASVFYFFCTLYKQSAHRYIRKSIQLANMALRQLAFVPANSLLARHLESQIQKDVGGVDKRLTR